MENKNTLHRTKYTSIIDQRAHFLPQPNKRHCFSISLSVNNFTAQSAVTCEPSEAEQVILYVLLLYAQGVFHESRVIVANYVAGQIIIYPPGSQAEFIIGDRPNGHIM